MARLSLCLLGTLQVTLDGTPVVGFESDKERLLLAYLAEESQQPHRREKLAGLLWPRRTEAAARNNLRRVLSNLRRLLGDRTPAGPPFLLVTNQTVRFNPAGDAWIDSLAFASLLRLGRQPPTQLEEAIGLYRGDFMDGFSVADSPVFEEWIVVCRERYQRMLRQALGRLVEECEHRGDYERALRLAWKQLDLEPWWEEAHQQLMRLLALSGRRSEAIAQYHRCARLLAEELGIAPSAETTGLFEQIRDGTLAVTVRSPRRSLGPTHNLPLAPGPFVGRESETAEIQNCLQDSTCRLLTLVGPGGMGKTRLALEAVTEWISRLQLNDLEGATLVPLTPVQTAGAIAPAIAQAAGFPLSPGHEPEQQLLEILRQKRWLLILDSFEHLPGGAGLVAEILRTAPHVKVLVTSRARLNLHSETCILVGGIEFPEQVPHEVQKARAFAAVELFLQATRRGHPGFEPADAELVEVARICRLVQGMPLGILLAAAWTGVLGPAEIATEIEKGLDFLEADWADVPERQRSLRAVFDGSWNLLTDSEREVLQALSVFSGGFDRAAAQNVSGASLYQLRSLAGKSLLQVTPSGRYQIHELLRQYAAEKLPALSPAATAARDRHSAYYLAALGRWEADLLGARQQEALREMEADIDNLRAAWTWALERGQVEQLGPAMEGLEHFMWQSGRYREGAAAFQAAAAAAETTAAEVDDPATCLRVRVRALTWQSNFLRATGQRDAAQQLQQKCLAILQDPALAVLDTRLERAVLSWSIGATECMEDYALGRRQFENSFSLFRDLDHHWGMAWALNAWGSMSMFLGEYVDASQRLKEGLAIYRALGNQSGIAGSLSRLANIACVKGRFEEAEALAREGYATALKAGSQTQIALALLDLGIALENAAKLSEAHQVLQQSLALFSDLGHRNYITEAHAFLGSVELHRGRYEEARAQAETGLAAARAQGPPYCVGLNLLLLGCLDLVGGDHPRAHQQLQDAIAAYQDGEQSDDLSWGYALLALAALALGDRAEAKQDLSRALQLAVDLGAVVPFLWALPAAALLLLDQGENERALELHALAASFPFVAESRWFADVMGSRFAAAAAAMPATRVALLEARGRARDLVAAAAELLADLRM